MLDVTLGKGLNFVWKGLQIYIVIMFSFRGTYAKITFAALSFVGGKYTT